MTPNDLNKELTELLNDRLQQYGFKKKKVSCLCKTVNDCTQKLSFSFTRDRGLPGNKYSLNPTLSFSFHEVDRLCCEFMGKEYDKREKEFGTGTKPLYVLISNDSFRYKYCSDNSLEELADLIAADFSAYALTFFDKYDSLDKLAQYFEVSPKHNPDGFSVIRNNGYCCCIAAVYCALERWERCLQLLDEDDRFTAKQRTRVREYIDSKQGLEWKK